MSFYYHHETMVIGFVHKDLDLCVYNVCTEDSLGVQLFVDLDRISTPQQDSLKVIVGLKRRLACGMRLGHTYYDVF
jgi:hypothetical protein